MAVDYDPKKAHEYYMQHRKLKGNKGRRKSRTTKGWSQQMKEQWAYAKDQLAQEHKAIGKGITEDSKEKRSSISERTKAAVSELRERLKGMSKEQKAEWRDRISSMIDELRGEAREEKAQLTEDTKGLREKEKVDYEARKDKAYETIKAMKSKNKKK